MRKIAILSLTYIFLMGCTADQPADNPNLSKRQPALNDLITEVHRIVHKAEKQRASKVINQAIENMKQQFTDLSKEQIEAIRNTAIKAATETALQIATQTSEKTANQIATQKTNQAIENMKQQFADLSKEQIEAIRNTAIKAATETALQIATQTSEKTANQIATQKTNQAIENMKQQFADLSKEQIEAIRNTAIEAATETALQIATQTSEKTANQIATQKTNQAIENMKQQFTDLSKEQIEAIRKTAIEAATETALQIATQTSEKTANQIATQKTNQAIENMKQQFADLSKEQIEAIRKTAIEAATATALQIATQTSEKTANQIAAQTTNQAIENMKQQFVKLSQTQIQITKEAVLETTSQIAENIANQIAAQKTNQAIENMKQQFADLSKEQIEAIRKTAIEAATETALQIATQTSEKTANQIAAQTTNQAIENMKQQFANFSELQIQIIKSATLEIANQIAKNTAEHIATASINQAIENMKQQFADLSKEQIEAVRKTAIEAATATALQTASQTSEKTANQIAAQTTNQAIENMKQQFTDLSKEQIEIIKSATLEVASATAREVTDNILEDLVKQTTFTITDRAIQEMEDKHSNLLKAGLQTIISAAIESVTASVLKKMDAADKKEVIDQATTAAVETAKDIIPLEDRQSPGYLKRQFFNLSFEQCDWKNKEYTARLVKDHSFFPLSDPLQNMLDSWDKFKTEMDIEQREEEITSCNNSHSDYESEPAIEAAICSGNKTDEEFAYLSPLYDDFILSFLKESIKDTYFSENDVPLECFFAGAVKGANIYGSSKHFYYCDKNSNKPKNMSVADNNDKIRNISPRACLNKDYMYLTARAFNKTADCFGFEKAEKEAIFKLLNHESSFLHNIKSPTGAKCYGQLTTDTIKEINKQIYFSDTLSPLPYSYIFNEVIETCPGLQNVILNPKIYEPIEQAGTKSIKKFNKIISQSPVTCKITQNPYSCLFYSFYNFKKNADEIEKQLKKPTSSFSGNNNIPQEFKDRFFLPISLGQMVGVTNSTGKDMIFWDDSELWPVLKASSPDRLSNIRQLHLFENEEEIKNLFKFWTYNGGMSIARDYMTRFIKQLKRSIAVPCAPTSQTKICQYRFSIIKGKGVSTADIKKDFQAYIKTSYAVEKSNTNERRAEVAYFTRNVERSLSYLYNKNGRFRIHLKNMLPELEQHEIEDFQDYLTDICPKP